MTNSAIRKKVGFLLKEIDGLMAKITVDRNHPVSIMEVCGGHTHSIFKYGLEAMLPKEIELVHGHGPGCPVCVLPSAP